MPFPFTCNHKSNSKGHNNREKSQSKYSIDPTNETNMRLPQRRKNDSDRNLNMEEKDNAEQENLNESDLSGDESSSDEGDLSIKNLKSTKGDKVNKSNRKYVKNTPFPIQLHAILSNESYSDIITWLPHGKSFIVLDRKRFVDLISNKYFKETKYESFTRKLNRWNFVRVARGADVGAFQHELFLRDDVSKCYRIRCQKKREHKKVIQGSSKKKDESSPQEETANNIEVPCNPMRHFLPNQLSSIEDIKKAQMEQMNRRRLLNYLSLKQQYDSWRNREIYHEKLKAQVLNDTSKKQIISLPDSPRLQDANALNFSSLMLSPKINEHLQQQLPNKIPTLMLPKSSPFPVLPTMSSIPENYELKIKHSLDLDKEEPELKMQSISKISNFSAKMQPKDEDDKLSMLVKAATRMTYPLKECDDYDSTKSNLPPKKRIKKRLSDSESSGSAHCNPSSISSNKETIAPFMKRPPAA